jgi:hypothetical protein
MLKITAGSEVDQRYPKVRPSICESGELPHLSQFLPKSSVGDFVDTDFERVVYAPGVFRPV